MLTFIFRHLLLCALMGVLAIGGGFYGLCRHLDIAADEVYTLTANIAKQPTRQTVFVEIKRLCIAHHYFEDKLPASLATWMRSQAQLRP